MSPVLAALPLLVAIAAMVARWSAPRAAAASLLTAAILTLTAFQTPFAELREAGVDLAPTLAEVLAILLGGVTLSRLLDASGDQRRIAEWLGTVCAGEHDRVILLMVLGVTPFAESVTGFGLGAVVAIPLLQHLGFSRARSLALGLLGLYLTTWGALATGTLIAAHLGGVPTTDLGMRSALFAAPLTLFAALVALRLGTGHRPGVGNLVQALMLTVVQSGALILSSWFLGHALGGALSSLAVIATSMIMMRSSARLDAPTRGALIPYAVLVAGLVVSTLLIRTLGWTGWAALPTHGSLWLMVASAVAALRLRRTHGDIAPILRRALAAWRPVGLGTGGFVILGSLLTATGMSTAIGSALAGTGPLFPFASAALAGLSGVVTGTVAGSNSMLAASQAGAASALGAAPLSALATQNTLSGVFTILSPTRVALARAVVGVDASDHVPETHFLGWLAALCAISGAWFTLVGYLW